MTQEVEADASGVLLKILAGEGEEIEVGKAIAVIGEEGEDVPDAEPEAKEEKEPEVEDERSPRARAGRRASPRRSATRTANAAEAAAEQAEAEPRPAAEANGDGARVKASPLARRIAREKGIDLRSLRGTGPEGRIVAEDVERAEAAPAPAAVTAAEAEVIPLTGMRKTIARRMTEAWQAPAFQITMTADMSAAIRLREALVARMAEGDAKPTYSDILTKVCAVALMRHRAVNALFAGDEIHLQPTANVGIAVAIPNGLVVPSCGAARRRRSRSSPPSAQTSSPARARTSSSRRTSRAERSRSPTSACSVSSASSPF